MYKHRKFSDDELQKGRLAALSEESKAKRKGTFKTIGHSQGIKNSQFGSMWITDGVNCKKIHKDDDLPDGWKRGRIIASKT